MKTKRQPHGNLGKEHPGGHRNVKAVGHERVALFKEQKKEWHMEQ